MPSRDELPRSPEQSAYRVGFRDGFDEAWRRQDDAQDGKADGDDDHGKKDEARKDDEKGDDEKDGDKKDDDRKDGDKKGGKKEGFTDRIRQHPLIVALVLVILLALIIAAIVFWRHSQHHETTDDAFVDGFASQVSAQAAGRVVRLLVNDNQLVDVGQPLLDIDPRDNEVRITQARAQVETAQSQLGEANAQIAVRRAAVSEARANARQSEADLTKAVLDLRRYQQVDPNAVARQQVDQAVTAEQAARAKRDAAAVNVRSAQAQVETALAQVKTAEGQVDEAKAQLANAELQGSYTRVYSPVRGHVSRRTVDVGNVISVGQPLLAVVSENLWVTANYKEAQLTKMQPGQSVEIVVDAFPDVTFHGKVDSIQRASGAYFSRLPAENATGNYVKIVQRVPVKITFDETSYRNYAIGPGMSVSPNVTLP